MQALTHSKTVRGLAVPGSLPHEKFNHLLL